MPSARPRSRECRAHHGSCFWPIRNPMTFTARCRVGVIRMMATSPRSASPEKNRGTDHPGFVRLRRSAPTTKSYWSRTGAFAPRGLCIRRLMNAPARSPRSAPKARTAEAPNATPTGPNDHVEFGAKRLNGAVKSRPRNAPDDGCDHPLARSARSTDTRSRRSDGLGDRSRSAWNYLCLEVDSREASTFRWGVRNPWPLLSSMIISPSPTYSAGRLVRRSSHGPFEDVRRGLRRGARRRHPTRLARPRRRHPGDDEDGPDVLNPVREREGRLEGPLHHAGREPRGPAGRDDGPRHDRPGRHGAVHPRRRPDPVGTQGRGADEELARRPPEVHRPTGSGEHVRPDRPRQPRGAVQPEPPEQPTSRAVPLLRLPEVPARDVLPDLRSPVREPRQTVVVRRRVPCGRDPVPGAGRARRRGRPAAPPVREDAPRAARARILRAEPERRPLPGPRDIRVRSSGGA